MNTTMPIPIVDLFAGPGGLGEGFSALNDGQSFKIVVSAERDTFAHQTLRMRAYYRLVRRENPELLTDYYDFCNGLSDLPYTSQTISFWNEAGDEALQIELGSEEGNERLDSAIKNHCITPDKPWLLIGGPPCQAYSLAGRSRNAGKADYNPADDNRHFLYEEYLRIIQKYKPAVFVMENVKGILSSRVDNKVIFHQILKDLASPDIALGLINPKHEYVICSLVNDEQFKAGDDLTKLNSSNFVVKAEDYGIPQARHRVILLGIRTDYFKKFEKLSSADRVSVSDVINDLPRLRSKLSKETDSSILWQQSVSSQLLSLASHSDDLLLQQQLIDTAKKVGNAETSGALRFPKLQATDKPKLEDWFLDKKLDVWLNHETRGHMTSDLGRYGYAASFAKINKRSPKGHMEFALPGLKPEHKNWESGNFSDRFRVQLADNPATTITSHISKDGHYFIHYDPTQCRSLTVREAARIQTFPDNYFFQGNRTQQYHQVGNAVPPLLANSIATIVFDILKK